MTELKQRENRKNGHLQAEQRRLERERRIQDLLPDEDSLGKAYDGRLVKRIAHHAAPYKGRLIAAVLLMAVSALLGATGPWIIGKAVDAGIRTGSLATVRFWSVVFIVFSLAEWLTNRGRIALMAYVGTKIVADLREALFRHLHMLSLNFYNNYSVGRLMSRLISDVGVLQDFVSWSLTGLTRALFTLIGIVAAMLLLNWQLALVTFAVLPLMILLTNYWRKHVREAYRATRQRLSLINGYLNESITGIRVTKSFTREERNYQHFDDLNTSYLEANLEAARLTALFFPGVDFMGALATALVVGVGGYLVLGDTLTAGDRKSVV